MGILIFIVKLLFILATVFLMSVPLLLEHIRYKIDNKKEITYKRLRPILFSLFYMLAVTLVMWLSREVLSALQSLSFAAKLAAYLAGAGRAIYFGKVIGVILINAVIGFLFCFLMCIVRTGLADKDLTIPQNADGTFSLSQKIERGIIRFFHTETWFYVGRILKWFNILLSLSYAALFIVFQLPAVFGIPFLPYGFISELFGASYLYPMITLIFLWQAYYFLEGMRLLEKECPALLFEQDLATAEKTVDLTAIDEEGQRNFSDYFTAGIEKLESADEEVVVSEHLPVTDYIAQAIENDSRNPKQAKEIYLNCLDQIVSGEKSIYINGNFFSEFSMYFLRYLSVIVARGDNIVLVCNDEAQIEMVYKYVKGGLSELSSLYCKDFKEDAVNYDDPIWRIVKISGEQHEIAESSVDENSILVTTLNYLCSTDFESQHSKFIQLIDTIVFVDTLNTINKFNRQLSILNTRMKHIAKTSALVAGNGSINERFKVRYMSRQVRYICFDDTRTPGIDKVLTNLLSVDFDSTDIMRYNSKTLVRFYNYEGKVAETGRRSGNQFIDSNEEVGTVMNMAVLCLAKGAGNVTVFSENVPYANISETITANNGRIAAAVDGKCIRLNECFYNPDQYSAIIVVDSQNDLPAVMRKYVSMTSDKPVLLMVFSRPYMLRDYYVDNIESLWMRSQIMRIPVEQENVRNVAQRILVKANAGGITEEEILGLCAEIPSLSEYAKNKNTNAILRTVLALYGIPQNDRIDLFRHFEYSSITGFDENGKFINEDRVLLRRQGTLFDIINGRNMAVMVMGDEQVTLSIPKSRITQNYITDQNLLYNGKIYHIDRIDTVAGKLYTHLAMGGRNDEAYEYHQVREYRIDCAPDSIEHVIPTKHLILNREAEGVKVNDVYLSVFRAPTEVITHGYYELDPHLMAINYDLPMRRSISDEGNDLYAKLTYRRYGKIAAPAYSTKRILNDTDLIAVEKGAQMMLLRMTGVFGENTDKTVSLAAAMVSEILCSMFPSVADSLVVCPILNGKIEDEEAKKIMDYRSRVEFIGDRGILSDVDFQLLVIEDSETDLGVISALVSAGDNILQTLFAPVLSYLNWYHDAAEKSKYLYYGLDHEPSCFDFAALKKVAGLVGDDMHDVNFVDIGSLVEYELCDFCGKRHVKGGQLIALDDGRHMCPECAGNLVGNNKKILRDHLRRAKLYLENTYGIKLDDDYEFCFESTVKIANTLKNNRTLRKRGSDAPLNSYIDGKKKVHIEYSIPSVNLSELLVRELTHVWQLNHLTDIEEDLAEGHIALVSLQYLRFLGQKGLLSVRTNYYETNTNPSGNGYRKLVRALLDNPTYGNNPFAYLLSLGGSEIIIPTPKPRVITKDKLGGLYSAEVEDRVTDGNVPYFYYAQMTASQQGVYDSVLSAIRRHNDTVIVDGFDFDTVVKIIRAITYDHPDLFYYENFSMCGNVVNLKYCATAEESEVLMRRIEEAVPRYLDGIDDSMSAYDVALRLHINVINSVDYDSIMLDREEEAGGPADGKIDYLRSICGVFLNGKAVCAGYARAMQYLLQKCGVECAYVSGYIIEESGEKSDRHAWNILKVDGDYYYLDTTWDDSSNTIQEVRKTSYGFDYFCITTDEMSRSRDFTGAPYDVPLCTATKANYHIHNGLWIDSYDMDKLRQLAKTWAEQGTDMFTFKCASQSVFEDYFQTLWEKGECFELARVFAKQSKLSLDAESPDFDYDRRIRTFTICFNTK